MSRMSSDVSNAGQEAEQDIATTSKMLREKKEREEENNSELMRNVDDGVTDDTIKYGTVIQLQHVKTGLFLACHKGSAPRDSDCRKVSLKGGSFAAQFTVQPRFKAQQEGSVLYYGYSFKLESANLDRMFLHTSPKSTYSNINDPDNTTLPKCLRTGTPCEVNVSADRKSVV